MCIPMRIWGRYRVVRVGCRAGRAGFRRRRGLCRRLFWNRSKLICSATPGAPGVRPNAPSISPGRRGCLNPAAGNVLRSSSCLCGEGWVRFRPRALLAFDSLFGSDGDGFERLDGVMESLRVAGECASFFRGHVSLPKLPLCHRYANGVAPAFS